MAANNILTFSEPWSTDFFDCCGNTKNRKDGWQTCCLTTWCPCVQYGKNVARLQPGEAPCGGNFAGACIGYVAMAYAEWALACLHNIGAPAAKAVGPLMGLQFALHLATRNAIRRKYNLKEHNVGDCLTVTFCAQCAMCQEHYQLTHEEHMGINPHLAYASGPGPQGMYAAVPQADPAVPPHMAPAQGVPAGNYHPPSYAVQGQATAPKGDCCKGV